MTDDSQDEQMGVLASEMTAQMILVFFILVLKGSGLFE